MKLLAVVVLFIFAISFGAIYQPLSTEDIAKPVKAPKVVTK